MAKNEKLKTLADNLNVFRSRTSIASEQTSLTLSHISSILCDSFKDATPEELDNEYKKLVPSAFGGDKIILYKEMASRPSLLAKMKENFSIGIDSTPAGAHGKISYVRNDLNTVAFDLLSERINNAKYVWEPSFVLSCESVSEGKSEFCILPIESSSDGKLFGFYSMMERYDLKIVSVCEVDDDRGETAKYALVAKSSASDIRSDGYLVFEFSLLSDDCDFLSELISAAKACDASTEKISFVPVKYDSNLLRYILSFKISSQNILPFKAFLALTYHSYTPIGCYIDKNIKEN